ncbi:MAG: metal ABC transporter ATP-binding protein [Campylobacterota bacterium]|nr:metal ABC transporter ATP-binding protein [Campylobacterota bacterium]
MKFSVPILETKNLDLCIGNQHILKNVSLQIFKGDYIALIGPNGGGKTTLVRLLLGLQKPSSGEIRLFSKKQHSFKEWNKIGYVPQRATQIDSSFPATVLEVVLMGRASKRGFFGMVSDNDYLLVNEAMLKMDVLDLQDKLIGTLSGGQRQRVMIARALASEPDILILDEPNTGVDMQSQERFYSLLRELNQKEKITIVFVTHDIGVIADDIGRLFTVNQTMLTCNNPKEAISCEDMSRLYGIDAHLIHNHHHEH